MVERADRDGVCVLGGETMHLDVTSRGQVGRGMIEALPKERAS